MSIKMWGNDGPLGHQTGYAPCFAALAGLASLVGYPGGPPTRGEHALWGLHGRRGRRVRGRGGVVASRTPRRRTIRRRVGRRNPLLDDRRLSAGGKLTGKRLEPDGNNHPDMCPHGCYPCLDGSWVSVAVANDAEWQRLCDVLDAKALAERYPATGDRRAQGAALDDELARLTQNHDAEQLAHRLRVAGVSAGKSATAVDVISDQRLWDRELYRFVLRSSRRPAPDTGAVVADDPCRGADRARAPDLGEDTDHVLTKTRRRNRSQNMTPTLAQDTAPRRPAPAAVSARRRRRRSPHRAPRWRFRVSCRPADRTEN